MLFAPTLHLQTILCVLLLLKSPGLVEHITSAKNKLSPLLNVCRPCVYNSLLQRVSSALLKEMHGTNRPGHSLRHSGVGVGGRAAMWCTLSRCTLNGGGGEGGAGGEEKKKEKPV